MDRSAAGATPVVAIAFQSARSFGRIARYLTVHEGQFGRVQGELPTGEQLPFESSLSLLNVRDVQLADDPQCARDPDWHDRQQHRDPVSLGMKGREMPRRQLSL